MGLFGSMKDAGKSVPTAVKNIQFSLDSRRDILACHKKYYKGANGDYYINGGMGHIEGIVGFQNMFKSTIADNINLILLNNYYNAGAAIVKYDSENSSDSSRINTFAALHEKLKNVDLLDIHDPLYLVQDNTLGIDQHFEFIKSICRHKEDKVKKLTTPFLDEEGKQIKVYPPTIDMIDTLTNCMTSDIASVVDKGAIGDKDQNMINMHMGKIKAQMLAQMPLLSKRNNVLFVLIGHCGKDIKIAAGGPPKKEYKALHALDGDAALKGMSPKFDQLATVASMIVKYKGCINSDKTQLYPSSYDDKSKGSKGLFEAHLRTLRNKLGESGEDIPYILSQESGLLIHLSTFHQLRDSDFGKSYGMSSGDGNSAEGRPNFYMDLYPSRKLSRTTIRDLLESPEHDYKLRRAVELTFDLYAMNKWIKLKVEEPGLLLSPKEVYAKLIEMGFDMDELLMTTSVWSFDEYPSELPYLRGIGLLKMIHEGHIPSWMDPKTKRRKVKK